MKPFSELFLECHDARVFRDKGNHAVLSAVYHKDRNTERMLEHNKYFLIGEKGTGKTMLAEYWSQTEKTRTAPQ